MNDDFSSLANKVGYLQNILPDAAHLMILRILDYNLP